MGSLQKAVNGKAVFGCYRYYRPIYIKLLTEVCCRSATISLVTLLVL